MIDRLRYLSKIQAGDDVQEELRGVDEKSKRRDYGTGAQILRDLGLNKIKLITDSGFKMVGLKAYGIEIVDRIPLDLEDSKESEELKRKYGNLEERLDH